ncbi:MAG TPA: hypothetical protein VLR72_01780 [Clostridiaceae bacterium]|nr:hypothetical protein [Clostridiaceae bacterium]
MDTNDTKILEYGESASDIFQVTRRKKRNAFDKFMDMLLNNFITLLDGLGGDEHIYVLYFQDRVELVEIESELRMKPLNISSIAPDAGKFEHLEYDGYSYKKSHRVK